MRRLGSIQLPVLLACGVFVAGCGSRSTSRPTTTTAAAAITACKQRIEASALTGALKDELKKSCEEASGDGMTAQAQMTRREVCRKIVLKRTPPGPGRERGLAACALNTRNP